MATIQQLKDAYIAATGSYPPRLDLFTDADVSDEDLANVEATFGGGSKPATPASSTSSSGRVTPDQILAVFNEAGVPVATANETSEQRASRIAAEINSGARTLDEVRQTIGNIAAGTVPNLGNPNVVTAGAGHELNSVPGTPEVWQDSGSGQYYLVYYVPETQIPMRYSISGPDLQSAFGPDQQIVVDRHMTAGQIDAAGALNFGTADELANMTGNPFDAWAATVDRQAAVRPWLRDPEVLGLIAETMLEHPDTGISSAEFQQTSWWRSHNDAQRQWLLLYESDPATAQVRISDYQTQVRSALEQYGMANPPDTLVETIANKWVTGDWSQAQVANQMRGVADPASGIAVDSALTAVTQGTTLDTASARAEDVRSLVGEWLGPIYGNWNPSQIDTWAGRLRNDPDAKDHLTELLRQQRMAMFPEYTNPNLTYENIAAPWRNFMSQAWGSQADETDPIFSQVLRLNDAVKAGALLRREGLSRRIGTVVQQLQNDVLDSFSGQIRAGA